MARLNAPREVPYDFKVVELEGVAWLYDNSERTFIASANPTIWMEPLYSTCPAEDDQCPRCLNGTIGYEYGEARCRGECGSTWVEDIHGIEPNYWGASSIEKLTAYDVPLESDEISASVPEKEAWDAAREEANANHLV